VSELQSSSSNYNSSDAYTDAKTNKKETQDTLTQPRAAAANGDNLAELFCWLMRCVVGNREALSGFLLL